MDSPRDDGLPVTCPEVFWGHHTQWRGGGGGGGFWIAIMPQKGPKN